MANCSLDQKIGHLVLWSALLALLCPGCSVSRAAERAYLRGDSGTALELLDKRVELAVNDEALQLNLQGLVALDAGDFRTARASLVDAGRIMGSFPETGAREISALIGRESTKYYLGDPYEAAMNSLYVAIVQLQKGDEQNARAALKNGILCDSDSEEEQYQSDIVALYLLEAWLSLRSGSKDVARQDIEHVRELDPDNPFADEVLLRRANTVIFVDTGDGPQKYAAGKHGEEVRFRWDDEHPQRVSIHLDGRELVPCLGVDVGFQATTRGGRTMDSILKGKAILKTSSEVAGAVLLDQGAKKKDAKMTALGGAFLVLSLLVQAQADTRHWYFLPSRTWLWIGYQAPGLKTARLEFSDDTGQSYPEFEQVWHYLPFNDNKINVYRFRSAPRRGFRRQPQPSRRAVGDVESPDLLDKAERNQ